MDIYCDTCYELIMFSGGFQIGKFWFCQEHGEDILRYCGMIE